MNYISMWWEKGGGTYGQAFEEKPPEDFENDKNDYCCYDSVDSFLYDAKDVTGDPKCPEGENEDAFDDLPKEQKFARLIEDLKSGNKILLDGYYKE